MLNLIIGAVLGVALFKIYANIYVAWKLRQVELVATFRQLAENELHIKQILEKARQEAGEDE